MNQQLVPVITADYLVSLHTMLEMLNEKVEQIDTKLESIAIPKPENIRTAPSKFEVSMIFFAAANGISKATVRRRVAANELPKPRVNPDNGYLYWLKSDLPKALHEKIDAHYHATTKESK